MTIANINPDEPYISESISCSEDSNQLLDANKSDDEVVKVKAYYC